MGKKRLTKQQRNQLDGFLIGEVLRFLKQYPGHHTSSILVINIPLLGNDYGVRRIVNLMRKENIPILSSSYGYEYNENKEDVWKYGLSLYGRASSMMGAHSGLMSFLDEEGKRDVTKFNFFRDGNDKEE